MRTAVMASLKGMMGRKLGMTQIFGDTGQSIPVTVLEVGPCTVLQKKTVEREGHNAVQLGFGPKPLDRLTMPEKGHVQKVGLSHGFGYIREFPVDDPNSFDLGQVLTLKDMDIRQLVDVVGVSKGCGFAGTIKRYGFHRGPMRHGSKHHRAVGSVGQSASPSRVIKGRRMPGRKGGRRTTVKNALVVDLRPEENLVLIRGGVPGAVNQMVWLKCK
jgi:large subunit ribosomal protein L3